MIDKQCLIKMVFMLNFNNFETFKFFHHKAMLSIKIYYK